jgi:hypothetical protein
LDAPWPLCPLKKTASAPTPARQIITGNFGNFDRICEDGLPIPKELRPKMRAQGGEKN